MKNSFQFTGPKRVTMSGWSRTCRYCGFDYHVSVQRGKSVRIAFKPRGQNRGWHWHGSVYREGKCVWSGRVPKSLGVRGLLKEAGVFGKEET